MIQELINKFQDVFSTRSLKEEWDNFMEGKIND